MSAGSFSLTRYEASYATGQIHPIRVQPETVALALTSDSTTTNAAPSGSVTNPISALVSRGARQRGLKPRKVTIRVTGTPPTGYESGSTVTLPILNEDLFAELNAGVSVNYLGTTWEVLGRTPEEAD